MRTTIFYIVGVTGLAVALLLALGAGGAWTLFIKRDRDLEEDQERSRSHRPGLTSSLPSGNRTAREDESYDPPAESRRPLEWH